MCVPSNIVSWLSIRKCIFLHIWRTHARTLFTPKVGDGFNPEKKKCHSILLHLSNLHNNLQHFTHHQYLFTLKIIYRRNVHANWRRKISSIFDNLSFLISQLRFKNIILLFLPKRIHLNQGFSTWDLFWWVFNFVILFCFTADLKYFSMKQYQNFPISWFSAKDNQKVLNNFFGSASQYLHTIWWAFKLLTSRITGFNNW